MKRKYIPSQSAAIAAAMAFSMFICGIISAADTEKHIEESLVRLHILANSDSEYDQQLKIKVRDAVLAHSDEIFAPYSSSDEAIASLQNSMNKITEIADLTLKENGSSLKASCRLEKIAFDDRVYSNMTVPAGEYTALRVEIGSGEGKNWWCVMYPPLCVPCAAMDMTEEEIMEVYGSELTEEDIRLLTQPEEYHAKLYIVEVIKKLIDENK